MSELSRDEALLALAILSFHDGIIEWEDAAGRARMLIASSPPHIRRALGVEGKADDEINVRHPSTPIFDTAQIVADRDSWKAKYMSGADLRQLLCRAEEQCASVEHSRKEISLKLNKEVNEWKSRAEKAEALWNETSKIIDAARDRLIGGGA